MPTSKRQTRSAKRSLEFVEDDSPQSRADTNNDVVDLTDAATPQKSKKKQKRAINDFFGSSPTTTTPAKSSSSKAALVTPSDKYNDKGEEEKKQEQAHIPTYLHKNVEYLRKGKAELSEKVQKIYDFVEKNFVIPEGFESNRRFGPLSGVCYEDRVINAYTNNLLQRKTSVDEGVDICTCCASEGHVRDDCPTLI